MLYIIIRKSLSWDNTPDLGMKKQSKRVDMNPTSLVDVVSVTYHQLCRGPVDIPLI